MKIVILDSHALLTFFEKERGWEIVAEALRQAAEEKIKLLIPVINWGEVIYVTLKEYDEHYAEILLNAMKNMPIEIVEVNKELTLIAAHWKSRGGLSYADCFVVGLAEMKKASEIITGDREFLRTEKHVKIRWL